MGDREGCRLSHSLYLSLLFDGGCLPPSLHVFFFRFLLVPPFFAGVLEFLPAIEFRYISKMVCFYYSIISCYRKGEDKKNLVFGIQDGCTTGDFAFSALSVLGDSLFICLLFWFCFLLEYDGKCLGSTY
ncbi:hypothetical protein J3E68DRAFT_325620 [Trichoderma sp. SZMC 28012]